MTFWYLKRGFRKKPVKGSKDYRWIQRTVVYDLRSRIYNEDGLSFLQYGAKMGFVPCVQAMLVTKYVFVVTHRMLNVNSDADKRLKSSTNSLYIDVTNLSQEYFLSDLDVYDEDCIEDYWLAQYDNTTFLESLLQTTKGEKAGEILETIPIVTISSWQWMFHMIFAILRLSLHLALMVSGRVESLQGVSLMKRSETTSLIFVLYISTPLAWLALMKAGSYVCLCITYWSYDEKCEMEKEDMGTASCKESSFLLRGVFCVADLLRFFSDCLSVEEFFES